jgi:hypothetical protein
VRDSLRIQIFDATTSISPVAMLGLTVPAERCVTVPSTAITYSGAPLRRAGEPPGRLFVEDRLGEAFAVAQVDENHGAVIAPPVDPSHQHDRLARVGGAQLAAAMSTAKLA